jgi:hypothetical protein
MDKEQSYKPVSRFFDMAQFGLTGLTGEACAYGMRMLCDVNEEGKALLADFFGMSNIELDRNWNSTVNEQPAIGSVMLSHDLVPKLAQFAFFRKGALAVVITDREVNGIFTAERLKEYRDYIEKYPNCGYRLASNHAMHSTAPMQGSRNVHAFTGRAN